VIDVPWLAEQFNVSLVWHERTHGHAGQRWVRELIVELTGQPEEGLPLAQEHGSGSAENSR
jgi:hypothetical protein